MVFRSTLERIKSRHFGATLTDKSAHWLLAVLLAASPGVQLLAADEQVFPESSFLAPQTPPATQGLQNDIDWNKTAVSRALGGRTVSDEAESNQMRASFGAGQTAYFFRNYSNAYSIWRPLAEQGFADAQASLGWLYQMGLGLEANDRTAFEWYLKAAEQGHAVAQNNLGVMYEQGKSVKQDLQKAINWYELSAKQGYRYGQYNVAKALLKSDRARREEIIRWLSAAAEQGVKQAADQLQRLSDK